MSHIPLYVGDLEKADRLYRTGLGMNLRTRSISGALFLAAGDYHHHVELNTWAGQVPLATDSDARLEWWSLKVPEKEMPSFREKMLHFGWLLKPDDLFAAPWSISPWFAR